MSSKITISLNTLPYESYFVELNSSYQNGLKETFEIRRFASYESTIGQDKQMTLLSLRNSLVADYNASGVFIIEIDELYTELSITHPTTDFFEESRFFQSGSLVNKTIVNTQEDPSIVVSDLIYKEADTLPCKNILIEADTNVLATEYKINDGSFVSNTENPLSFEHIRGSVIFLTVKDNEGNEDSIIRRAPYSLVSSNIEVTYVNSPQGATVTITVSDSEGLDIEYSLDNITYKESNTYSGLFEGDYTVYVRDQLGCEESKEFTIESFEDIGVGERVPYSDLPSKSNSIRYSKIVDTTDCSNYKNEENTLTSDIPYVENACSYSQLFQSCDIITTQFKTNYRVNKATVIYISNTPGPTKGTTIFVDQPVVQKSNNTDLKDSRDGIIYNLEGAGQQSGIYFTNGKTYNYDTGEETGDYSLNGNLPSWGTIGNFLFYNNAWFEILNIVYDDSKSAYVLVINLVYTNEEAVVKLSSIYNVEKYNIFEFDIDMSLFNDKQIQVNITQTDENLSFEDEVYLSEIIDIATVQKGTILIEYYNDTNTDIFYATGIINKIRMPIEYLGGGYSDSTESEKTDSNTYLINAEAYENDTIFFKLMPKQIMRKVFQALAHKFVFLNEVQYIKEDSPEINHLVGTNLYRLSALMTKANAVYTSKGLVQGFIPGPFEAPALLNNESNGYIKIKQ